jgi:type IV pilus assembly protein PilA
VEIMIVVVIIGLLAAIAIPAFQKTRQTSQERAVLNNVRQISGAADQYYMEHGATVVAVGELIGPDKYMRVFATVAAEHYPSDYTQGVTITVSAVGGARTVTFAP